MQALPTISSQWLEYTCLVKTYQQIRTYNWTVKYLILGIYKIVNVVTIQMYEEITSLHDDNLLSKHWLAVNSVYTAFSNSAFVSDK